MDMQNFVELAGSATEIAGVALIVGGFVLAALRWMALCRRDGSGSFQRLRQDLSGRAGHQCGDRVIGPGGAPTRCVFGPFSIGRRLAARHFGSVGWALDEAP
jgi:hypothetical protein